MLIVHPDGSVQLTRGDSAEFEILITNKVDNSTYTVQAEDRLVLSMKKTLKDTAPVVLQKTITGSNLFVFEPSDTNSLSFGDYYYDVQMTTADGRVFTVIPPVLFKITAEVTCSNDT